MAKNAEIEQTVIEAPYELPEGWKWCRLGEVVEVLNGYAFKSENYVHQGIRVIRITNVQDGYIEDLKPCFYPKEYSNDLSQYTLYENDLLISLTGNVGRVALLPKNFLPAALNQRVGCLREKNNQISKKYIAYYLRQHKFLSDCIKSSKGTAQLNMSTEWLKRYPIPLPPTLAEQQRIVNRIETMFAKLDQAQEKAQNVVASFETRKAAILHKAFTGKLTAKWRKENGVSDDSWEEKTLQDVCKSIYDGDHMPPPKADTGVYFLVISNVNTGYLSFENTRFVTEEYFENLSETRKPSKGDILYTLVGSYGIPVVVDCDTRFCFQRHMALFKPKSIDTYFLWYLLQANEFYNKATEIATGTAQLTVPIKGLRKIVIKVPCEAEQKKLVHILNTILEKESKAKEAAKAVLEQIDLLKKSILARAFRGEL